MQIKHLIYTLLAGVSFSACNLLGPVDDIHPDYVLTDDNVITDANSAEYLLNGIYQYYRQREFASLRPAMFILTGTLLNSDVEGSTNFANNDVRIENNAVLNYYTVLYSIINQANSLIVQLENKRPQGLSDTRKSEILGEAYFHKAFADRAGENHLGNGSSLLIGNPQTVNELSFLAKPVKQARYLLAAPVDDDRFQPDELQKRNVLDYRFLQPFINHCGAAIFDYYDGSAEFPYIRDGLYQHIRLLHLFFVHTSFCNLRLS